MLNNINLLAYFLESDGGEIQEFVWSNQVIIAMEEQPDSLMTVPGDDWNFIYENLHDFNNDADFSMTYLVSQFILLAGVVCFSVCLSNFYDAC